MNKPPMVIVNESLALPYSELEFRYSTSGGPGGQHSNRSSTRVTLRFDVARSASLTDDQRQRIMSRLSSRLDREGVLQLHESGSRSQSKNREQVTARFQQLLAEALVPRRARKPTRPSRAGVERRLRDKRARSERKKERSRGKRGEWQ
jgi:ribosome-associated protein